MTRLLRLVAVSTLAIASTLVGCLPGPATCTTEAVGSLSVIVEDDVGAPIENATVTAALEGGETKTCTSSGVGDGSYFCDFFEVAGTFTVTATRGAATDSATAEVEEGECHVAPARVALVLPAA